MTDVTRILQQIEGGDRAAAAELLPLVYDQLRALATARLVHERPGQTLQATALVHEAYLRLVGSGPPASWDHRGHFFAAAAEAMRRILVETARRKQRTKHGGQHSQVPLADVAIAGEQSPEDLLALDEALERLAREDPEKARIVQLRYFAGLSHDEVAAVLGISAVTVKRHWRYARAWLRRQMRVESCNCESSDEI